MTDSRACGLEEAARYCDYSAKCSDRMGHGALAVAQRAMAEMLRGMAEHDPVHQCSHCKHWAKLHLEQKRGRCYAPDRNPSVYSAITLPTDHCPHWEP